MTKPKSNGRGDTRPYIVTVTTAHYVNVTATDVDHARKIVERQMVSEFGATRTPTITEIEEA